MSLFNQWNCWYWEKSLKFLFKVCSYASCVSTVHPHAGAIWSLPLYGCLISERHSGTSHFIWTQSYPFVGRSPNCQKSQTHWPVGYRQPNEHAFTIHLLSLSLFLALCLTISLSIYISALSLSVLWPSEVVWDASKAPARLYLPSSCSSEEGPPLHCHSAHLPHSAVGH